MENVLYNFYHSFSKFLAEMRQSKISKQKCDNDDVEKGLTMDQMMFPLIVYFVSLGICFPHRDHRFQTEKSKEKFCY